MHEESANDELVHYLVFILMYANLTLTNLPVHSRHPLLLNNRQPIITFRGYQVTHFLNKYDCIMNRELQRTQRANDATHAHWRTLLRMHQRAAVGRHDRHLDRMMSY